MCDDTDRLSLPLTRLSYIYLSYVLDYDVVLRLMRNRQSGIPSSVRIAGLTYVATRIHSIRWENNIS